MIHSNLNLESRCIHGGQHPEPTTGAVMPPIFTSSTFVQESPGVHKGFEYSRSHNATRFAFERCVANLESSGLSEADDRTCGGFAFASGLAAIGTALEMLDHGAPLVCMDDVYGGTFRLLTRVRVRSAGLHPTYLDLTDASRLETHLAKNKAGMVWVNCYKRVHPGSPFGGVGQSGYGRDLGTECMQEYTESKSVWVNYDAQLPPFYPR